MSAANLKAHRAGRSYKEQWVSISADVKGDASLQRAERLHQSILSRAFSGGGS